MWGKREYQEAVVTVIMNTKHLRARESLLELIQSLGITYADDSTLKFGQAYKELLTRHRISFPPPSKQPFVAPTAKPSASRVGGDRGEGVGLTRSSRHAPDEIDIMDPVGLYGPERSGKYEEVRRDGGSSGKRRNSASGNAASKKSAKEASIEEQLDSVSSSLSLLNDVIDNLGPSEKVSENELIPSILPEIEKTHETIMRILQSSDTSKLGEVLTARLFSANDAIAETLGKLEKAKKGIRAKRSAAPAAPAAPPKPALVEDDPFDEFDAIAKRNRGPSAGASSFPPMMLSSALPASHPNPRDAPPTQPIPMDLLSLVPQSPPNQTPPAFSTAPANNPFDSLSFPPSSDFGGLSLQPISAQPVQPFAPSQTSQTAPSNAQAPFNFAFPPMQPTSAPFIQQPPHSTHTSPSSQSNNLFGNDSLI